MATVDLTVRGAGIFGLATAWMALQRGATVRLIDPNGVASGASGGIVGALQPHTPDVWNEKKQFQFDALTMAPAFWQQVEATSGRTSGFARAGRLQPLAGEREIVMARARAKGAAEFWGAQASWNVVESQDAGNWRAPSETGLYIHDTLSAILHPRRACESLAAAIRVKGGEIVAEAPDEGLVLWATGWRGLEDLSEALAAPIGNGVKGQAALLQHDASGCPQIFANGLHIIPHTDGTVAIGSTSEREFTEPHTTDHLLDDIILRAKDLMPVLRDAPVISRWAGVRPRAKSRAPLLGAWPGRRQHFVANGGFKIGFGVAPMIAQTMCDLMLDGKDSIPDGFRLTT
ncbi:NAD(P)/FAD-dependent oxidoreductase [Boseongicola aestuarii]|uniref:Glycine oxidase n=1 Tax=Boseongicola aestuarii TaxID=1470561 RepID=A0A238IXU5_9RHOB|nr:FAD-binding oxidoreductase [Boseongicola aestuarii]SMX23309.1 Glycine oxidase [Boseongicola aestuarii]